MLAVVSLSWAVAFDLTPKASRPYAGSSHDNSMLELIVMHNGLERFVRNTPPPTPSPAPTPRFVAYDAVPVGALRLADPALAMQFAWTLPLAVLGAVFAWRRRRAQVALWSVWALTYGIVYSLAGGIFHAYYLSTLGPPLAALAGIGCFELWRRGATHLAIGVGAAALWQGYIAGASLGWTSIWVGFPAVALLAAIATQWRAKRPPAVIGGVALLVLPALWALSAVFAPGNLTLPSASLPRWLGIDDGRGPILSRNWTALTDDPKLQAFLQQHRGNARFLLAAPNALLAAPVIIGTGQPVMAFGGFFGNDPVMSVDAFAKDRRARRGALRGAGHQPAHARLRALGARPRHDRRSRPVALPAARAATGDRALRPGGEVTLLGARHSVAHLRRFQYLMSGTGVPRSQQRLVRSPRRCPRQDGGLGALAGAAVAALQPPHQEAGDGKDRDDHARHEHQELVAAAEPMP